MTHWYPAQKMVKIQVDAQKKCLEKKFRAPSKGDEEKSTTNRFNKEQRRQIQEENRFEGWSAPQVRRKEKYFIGITDV
jgi:hypothetical protein